MLLHNLNIRAEGPDGIHGAILKMGEKAMIPYLARLLDIKINHGTIPRDWKKKPLLFLFTKEAIVP